MHVPAWPVLPDQTIAPPVSEAFRVPAMGGMGAMVCDLDICYDDGTGSASSSGGIDFSSLPPLTVPQVDLSQGTVPPWMPTVDLTAVPPTPAGSAVNVPNRSGGTTTLVNRGTQAQPNYVPVLAAATQGAFDIAKLMAIQPGTLQQGNVTTRQTAGFPVSAPSTSTVLGVQAGTGGSLLIAAAVGLAAVLFLSSRR